MGRRGVGGKRTPSAGFSAASFLAVIAVLAVLIYLGVNTTMSVFAAAAVSAAVAGLLNIPWRETERALLQVVADCIPTFLIVIMVGMLVGIWMAGGTVPSLMYYSMALISPQFLVPLAFLLCFLCAEFTGSSFGSVATMGLAVAGAAAAAGIPPSLTAGAVVSGAWFGDKMSPMSDTTNLTSGISRTPLYEHIHSMLFTAVPAAAATLALFTAAGLPYGGGAADTDGTALIRQTLAAHFHISPLLILPAALALLVSILRLPALLGMGLTVLASAIFALAGQDISFVELMDCAANGFSIQTGEALVDNMLSRGGIAGMTNLLVTFMAASVMGGIITATGILDVLARDVLLRFIRTPAALIFSALLYCYAVNFLTAGGQTVAIIVTQQTFGAAFDRMGLHRKVLSRTLEDAGTLSAPVVPWGVAALFVTSTLGCDIDYIRYCWFIYLVPLFSLLCAVTGFGLWDKDGGRLWGGGKRK